MNKFSKSGFSLAEILIALGIISVIATMGFSVAKKGIADAYTGYFYTGYVGMYNALEIANRDIYGQHNTSNSNPNAFIRHVINVLNLRSNNDGCVNPNPQWSGSNCYIAPNGIRYLIYNRGGNPPELSILMQVPSVKTKNIPYNYRLVPLIYADEELKPLGLNDTNLFKEGFVDLTVRKDLLAFTCIEKPNQIVHDCKDAEETNCAITYQKGNKIYLDYHDAQYANCEEIKITNPRYMNY